VAALLAGGGEERVEEGEESRNDHGEKRWRGWLPRRNRRGKREEDVTGLNKSSSNELRSNSYLT